ncbi:MAG: transposase [Sandaracinobacter sp.]
MGPLLPAAHGRGCRPSKDNRLYFEGMLWMARTGSQWRHLPDEYSLPRRRLGARQSPPRPTAVSPSRTTARNIAGAPSPSACSAS